MRGLSLQLLGPFSASLNGKPLGSFRTRLAQALLIYLACEPVRHRREHLMALLWPGLPQTSAQQNLRQNLYLLRRAIPEVAAAGGIGATPLVLADHDTLQLNPAAAVVVDVRRFAALIGRIRPGLGEMEEAVALYRGDFLADFYLPDSNPFEEWAAAHREALRRDALDVLRQLTARYLADDAYDQAEACARRQLTIDPLHDSANRQLMEILARGGRRHAALAHYEQYRRLLSLDLGIAPGAETLVLVDAIQSDSPLPSVPRDDGAFPAIRHPDHIRGYEIHEELGRGSYGVAFRATQPVIGRDVAIKVISARYANDADFIRRFETEAQIIAQLEHPQIVPLYDYWREPGNAYLVMRYLRGGSLDSSQPWPPERAAHLIGQIAAALAHAHQRGIIHRDVKPTNILLDEEGNPYLADFGLAKLLQQAGEASAEETMTGTPDYLSPEQIQSRPTTPLSDQYSLGLVAYQLLIGEKPYQTDSLYQLFEMHLRDPLPPVHRQRPDIPAAVDHVLGRATAKNPADRFPDILTFAGALRAAVHGELDAEAYAYPIYQKTNPYKGLLAFTEADAGLFHGRKALTGKLLAALDAPAGQPGFLALVGPSGGGKSSLVQAGLVPRLRQGAIPGSENWFVLDMIPGAHPYEELEAALLRIAVNPPASLLEMLQAGDRGLLRTVRRILPAKDSQLLLIIDQFEELFTLVADREITARFLDALVAAVTDPRSPLRVIVTLRADFYDRPLLYPGLSELMQQHTEVVVPLSTDELVRAIERPAAQAGVEIENELVAALVADVQAQAGALPLLQYTLSELFETRERDRLTLEAYRQLGGIGGALALRADAVYDELDDEGRTAARTLFSRLVTLGEGVEDTRRRVLRGELEALTLSDNRPQTTDHAFQERAGSLPAVVRGPSSIVTPLDRFGRARLLSFDHDPVTRGPTVEIAHEALLRAWPRLRGWLGEDRAMLRLSRLLTAAAIEWETAGHKEGFLLRGARLNQLAPLTTANVALTGNEQRYLEASLAAREARRTAEEERRQAEIDIAQKLAETERGRADEQSRTARRLRLGAALLAAALGVAAILAFLALNFAQDSARSAELAVMREKEALASAELASTRETEALENARLATSRELSSEATNALAVDPELSILLALEASQTLDTNETREALHTAVQASRVISAFDTGATGRVSVVMDVSPDGERLVTAGQTTLSIWDVATGATLAQLPLLDSVTVHHSVGFDSDGASVTLVSAPADAQSITIQAWSPGDKALSSKTLPITHDAASIIAISPDRSLLAVSHEDMSVELWDTATGRLVATLSNNDDVIVDLAFDPTGRLLAVAEMSGQAMIWDVAALEAVGEPEPVALLENSPIMNEAGALLYARFVSDTQLVLGYLGDVEVWDLSDLANPRLTHLPQALLTLGYGINENGTLLATATQDGSIQIWNLVSGERSLVLAQHQAPVNVVRFIDGDRRLISIDRAGHVRIWDARLLPLGERESLSVDQGVFDIELSPDGRLIATGSVGGPASLWDAATGERLLLLPGEAGGIYRVDISPDGRAVAGVGRDNRLHVWDTVTGEEILSVPAHGDGVSGGLFQGTLDVAYSPDGSRLATAGADGLAKVWDAATGELLLTFAEHTDSLHSLAYSPDGRYIATTSDENDASVKVWDAQTGQVVYSLTGHPVRVWGLAFSPDSRYLVTGGARGVIKLWDMATGEEIYTVFDEADHIGSVRFSPDGEWFVTTGEVPTRIRRTADGSEVVTLTAPIVWSADISDDSRYIYGADVNGMVRVLVAERDDLIALAHERLTRWWRPDECVAFLHTEECPPAPARFPADN